MFSKIDTGHTFESSKILVHFGNKDFTKDTLNIVYPNYYFSSLHQIHSNICVETKIGSELQADAHYTYDKLKALLIKTADCIPLFIYCELTDTVAAVHAGWRGLESKIIAHTMKKAFKFSKPNDLLVFVGPHIFRNNYEFQEKELLRLSLFYKTNFYYKNNNKYFLDIDHMLTYDLLSCGIDNDNIYKLNKDTFSSDDYHSYRRDGIQSGRLFHFIVRK